MKMVLNELSYQFPSSSISEGKKIMENFLVVYINAVKSGIADSVIIDENLDHTLLAPEYPIAKWRNDRSVDIEIVRIYKRMNDKSEFSTYYLSEESELIEFTCNNGKSSTGIKIASEQDFLSISFLSDQIWDTHTIDGIYTFLGPNEEICEENRVVYHASQKNHINKNKDWIEEKVSSAKFKIKTGKELWEKREQLFPSLLFCESVKEQINNIHQGTPELKQIIKKLDLLDKYFFDWQGEAFVKDKLPNVDPQSQETLKRFKDDHKFEAPDGRWLIFSWHIRFTGGTYPGRIFFYPDNKTNKCIIGHINGKLPTVKYPNP